VNGYYRRDCYKVAKIIGNKQDCGVDVDWDEFDKKESEEI